MTMHRSVSTPAAREAWDWWEKVRASLPVYRMMRGMSQRRLAAVLGTSQGNVGTTETGPYVTMLMPRFLTWTAALDLELSFTAPDADRLPIRAWTPDVGQWVARRRQEQRLSQRELGALMGLSRITVTDLERGAGVRVPTLAAAFIALGWQPHVTSKPKKEQS